MPRIMISAGESSGDDRAAALLRELRALDPGVEAFGMGGPLLAAAGCRLVVDNSKLHVMGFVEVLAKASEVRAAYARMIEAAAQEKPDLAVLVDYPDFHMRLAARLRALGVRTVYYVSPQVWAWRPGRARKMGRICEKMLALFPFEEDIYRRAGVPAECVGHPLGDELPGDYPAKGAALRRELLGVPSSEFRVPGSPEQAPASANPEPGTRPSAVLGALSLSKGNPELLALLPGSRPMELARHLEVFCRAARLVREARPGVRPVLAVTAEAPAADLAGRAREAAGFEIPVLAGRTREALAAADVAAVVSGTATLEAALLGCPMVVCYRTGWLNFNVGRLLVTIPCIALANVVAGRPVVPELLQSEVTPRRVADALLAILEDPAGAARMRGALSGVREKLGPRQSSRRAAEAVLGMLKPEPAGTAQGG